MWYHVGSTCGIMRGIHVGSTNTHEGYTCGITAMKPAVNLLFLYKNVVTLQVGRQI